MSQQLALPEPDDAIATDGPWTHRTVTANAARFHIVEAGSGPLVLLLHGFPMFWYTWRNVVPRLADSGYRAVAMDLRGYGGSDKTPHGYDPLSLVGDITGVIKSMGARDATIVGHGWGGLLAWTVATTQPQTVRAIAPVSMPHPTRLRESLKRNRAQRKAVRDVWGMQLPFVPERRLTDHGAQRVARILRERSIDDAWLTPEVESKFRAAMLSPASAHCALEYYRWAIRSIPRRDGRAFRDATAAPTTVPVLHVQGRRDPMMLPSSADGSGAHVTSDYLLCTMDAGHFPHEEQPDDFATRLTQWLAGLD